MSNWINALRQSDLLQEVDSDQDLQKLAELSTGMEAAAEWFDASICLDSLPTDVADVVNISIGQLAEAVSAWYKQQSVTWEEEQAERDIEAEQQRDDEYAINNDYLSGLL